MTKSDLMRKMHRAGLRLDDAALAAQVAIQAHQSERNRQQSRAARLAHMGGSEQETRRGTEQSEERGA